MFKGEKRLAANNGPAKRVQRILIFDNHPETLDLIFGREADPEAEESTSWWEPVLAWMLAAVIFFLLFLWLFLKLRS
jgi:hypothetical protein